MKNIKRLIAKSYLIILLGLAMPGVASAHKDKHKEHREKYKEWVDSGSHALKRGIDVLGDDLNAIQDFLNNYPWKGLVREEATLKPATLKNLTLNGRSKIVAVRPGERIDAKVDCIFDPEECSLLGVYHVVVGIKGEGPQAVIANELGIAVRTTEEEFTLTAPMEPGLYQIRFRPIEAISEAIALSSWKDAEGKEPDSSTTVGLIFVKR